MFLLVALNVITKSITTLIRGEGGKCVLTRRMSEMTGNTAIVSTILQLLVGFFFTAVACCIKLHKFLIVSVVLYKGVC